MKDILKIILVLISVIYVCSCSTINLSPQDKASLKTISLSNQVKLNHFFYFAGGSQYGAAMGGLVGYAIAGNIMNKDMKKITSVMDKNKIDLKHILLDQLSHTISHSGYILDDNSNAKMSLEVINYGFVAADLGFSVNSMKFMLEVEATIIKNRNIIWRKSEGIRGISDLPNLTLNDILQKPELLRQSIIKASKEISIKLVTDLKK